jgi:hypothetical protein
LAARACAASGADGHGRLAAGHTDVAIARYVLDLAEWVWYNRHSSKHSARLHFKDSKGRLQFMYGLSDFGVFANFVLQSLQQIMRSRYMLCCLS